MPVIPAEASLHCVSNDNVGTFNEAPISISRLVKIVTVTLMWEVLLYMCCFYWLTNKESTLACDRASRAWQGKLN